MKLGEFRVPEPIAGRIRQLIHDVKAAPYKPACGLPSFEDRLQKWLYTLERHYFDTDAALAALSLVKYVNDSELDDAWRSGHALVVEWLKTRKLAFSDVHFLCKQGESHREHYIRAIGVSGRNEERKFSKLENVEGMLSAVELALHRPTKQGKAVWLNRLRGVSGKSAWVLLWDLLLSGKTASSQLRRLEKLVKIVRPKDETLVMVVSQVASEEAIHRVRATMSDLKMAGGVLAATVLEDKHRVQNAPELPDDLRDRVTSFCSDYFKYFVDLQGIREKLKNVGPFGYTDDPNIRAGWTIVTVNNAPNNSIPPIWHPGADREDDSEARGMVPFPRILSKTIDEPIPDPSDGLTSAQIDYYSETLLTLFKELRAVRPSRFLGKTDSPAPVQRDDTEDQGGKLPAAEIPIDGEHGDTRASKERDSRKDQPSLVVHSPSPDVQCPPLDLWTPGPTKADFLLHYEPRVGAEVTDRLWRLSRAAIAAVGAGNFARLVSIGRDLQEMPRSSVYLQGEAAYLLAEGLRLLADIEHDAHKKSKLSAEAFTEYGRARELMRDDPRPIRGLGRIYEIEGDYSEAIRLFQVAKVSCQLALAQTDETKRPDLVHEILRSTRHFIHGLLEMRRTSAASIWHREHKRRQIEGYLVECEEYHMKFMPLFEAERVWFTIEWFMGLVFLAKAWGDVGNTDRMHVLLLRALDFRRKLILPSDGLSDVEQANLRWWLSVARERHSAFAHVSIDLIEKLGTALDRCSPRSVVVLIDGLLWSLGGPA